MPKLTELISLSKRFYNKNRGKVVDIVLFGSLARKKKFPSDIDICLILKKRNQGLSDKFKKLLKSEFEEIHFSCLSLKNFPGRTLWQTLLHEGYSLTKEEKWAELLGYETKVLYWYRLKDLKQSDKVRFYYALKGRKGEKGILQRLNGKHLGKGVIMLPLKGDDEMKEFFLDWGVPFHRREILVGK